MADLEELKEIRSFGLTCEIEFSILEVDYGDDYDDSALMHITPRINLSFSLKTMGGLIPFLDSKLALILRRVVI